MAKLRNYFEYSRAIMAKKDNKKRMATQGGAFSKSLRCHPYSVALPHKRLYFSGQVFIFFRTNAYVVYAFSLTSGAMSL